jgi:Bifunctional DNA primase/polymerase, N-terminal
VNEGATTIKPRFDASVLEAAREYVRKGWTPIPLLPRQKLPSMKGWQNARLNTHLDSHFEEGENLGLLLGEASSGLCDVDIDCGQALALASLFLPHTGRVHGRRSKPSSHHWYVVQPVPEPHKYLDADGTCLVEIRANGQQTAVPPSVHPSGESLIWERSDEPAIVDAGTLESSVGRLATAVLIARHWPKPGNRHEAALALAGMLLRGGWREDETCRFVTAVAKAANDEEYLARAGDVSSTVKRLAEGAEATGSPRLVEFIGQDVVERARKWLRIENLAPIDAPYVKLKVSAPEWPEAAAEEAFYGLAGNVVRLIEPHSEADRMALLVQFLVAFGNLIGRGPHFMAEADAHFTNLFAVLVGRTAKGRLGLGAREATV